MDGYKHNETIVIRNGKLMYAISLCDKGKPDASRGSYITIQDGEINFSDGHFSSRAEFDFGNDAHRAAKEIFVAQLQVDIKRRILELKQLEAVFREIGLPECLGSVLVDNTALLTEIRDEIGKNKETTKEAVRETVRDIALKPVPKEREDDHEQVQETKTDKE